MTVDAIKDAIQHLSEDERTSLVTWLNEMESDEWDEKMAMDLSSGGSGQAWTRQIKQDTIILYPERYCSTFKSTFGTNPAVPGR